MRITDFGAIPDGVTRCTQALEQAIDAVSAQGGGRVTIPSGHFVTGGFLMKPHVELHLEHGAVLRGSSNLADYPIRPFYHREWNPMRCLLFAQDCPGVRLSGSGIIDLNDEPFMKWDVVKLGDSFGAEMAANLTEAQRRETTVLAGDRPNQCLFFDHCHDLTIEGITIRRAPCWSVTVSRSRNVRVTGVRLDHHRQVPNSDGFHFCACDGVIVSDCHISCGDDCIAFTAITDPTQVGKNLVVTNCILRSSSSGIRVAHLDCRIRNVRVSNCQILDSNRGVVLEAGEGGHIENVDVTNCTIETRMQLGHWWGRGEPLVVNAHHGGVIDGVTARQIRSRADNSVLIRGGERVTLQGWEATVVDSPNRAILGGSHDLQPAPMEALARPVSRVPWVDAKGCRQLTLESNRVEGGRLDVVPLVEP